MNISFLKRYLWVGILLGLLVVNLVVYWPKAKAAVGPVGFLPGKMGEAGPGAQLEAAVANLPEAERKKMQERLAADRAFFESVKDLTEAERRQKVQEHFAQNPPPEIPGMARPGPPPAGSAPPPTVVGGNERSGGPAGPPGNDSGPDRLPDPFQRRQMDQQIADSQKTQQSQ